MKPIRVRQIAKKETEQKHTDKKLSLKWNCNYKRQLVNTEILRLTKYEDIHKGRQKAGGKGLGICCHFIKSPFSWLPGRDPQSYLLHAWHMLHVEVHSFLNHDYIFIITLHFNLDTTFHSFNYKHLWICAYRTFIVLHSIQQPVFHGLDMRAACSPFSCH